ncbi:hypothetical protein SAMN04488104_103339 [Algoriphagus faecimaris]|uniref:DUF2178 domain-containing protein n=1 Tax=Algoriphagus faecimaris TaxID=686796 RepID=A0A1G6V8W9_9BACT|nr:hypothetical protein [Algoriphagus faecimaris]SDD49971.1 hypothetical protein SAMN04488104_103339 [Algoriphagus faecimaris]
MKTDSLFIVPLFEPAWKRIALIFFPLPVLLVIGLGISNPEFDPNDVAQIIYGFWAIAFAILNLTREKVEDEMIQMMRLKAFQTGFFWLIWGMGALMLINYVRFERFTSEMFTAYLILFLLNVYIYAAFRLQLYLTKNDK